MIPPMKPDPRRELIPDIRFLLCVILLTQVIAAAADCIVKEHNYPVSQKRYKELQKYVNKGHQPWHTDAAAVATSQILAIEHVAKEDWDVYGLPLKPILE